ncbi:hypothetical protein [Costertonia aggregata]|uniref:Lipocalin-like domain-containing protein n=1 Tax=Costertonia aggregata TaxID=343403 RepID=A0A7H9ARS8_9FLAO|nr:hypothetical protein [Costertonia aggregata]QLG46126.1 hypothetical protein HYG79_12465 [Costertonia aggregata]
MKKFFNHFMYSSLLILALVFTSCQEEFEQLPDGNEKEVIRASSTTAVLIEKTSSKDGSFDNIVDGASCFAVNFPYTVEIEGIQITIDSLDDLHTIEEIFDEFDGDDDILEIIFPITITLADFTEIVINGKEDLRRLAAECVEGGDDDDIECVDFVYPISFFTFNTSFEQTGTVTINSDMELRKFFVGMEDDDLISIDFPVTLKLYDGTEVVVNTNAELANTIETTKEACDEDDDNDYNDDDFKEKRFDEYLKECPWFVRIAERNDMDRTPQYENYKFTFLDEEKVEVKDREGNILNGEWEFEIDDNGAILSMEFETLVDFNLEWRVYEIDERRIKLFNGESNRIIMKQICGNDQVPCDEAFIADVLSNCVWSIGDGDPESFLNNLTVDFSDRNIHVRNPNGEVVDEGNWSVSGTTLSFNDLSMELANYIGQWDVVECGEQRFKLKRDNEEYLIIEKICE